MGDRRPTLLNACASAATAAEARYRVDYPNSRGRASRIIGLDVTTLPLMGRLGDGQWDGARFLTYSAQAADTAEAAGAVVLHATDGRRSTLEEELAGADVVVMIATGESGAEAASLIGDACRRRRVMTAGLVLGERDDVEEAVTALRPYATVLVVSPDDTYVQDMLSAIRA